MTTPVTPNTEELRLNAKTLIGLVLDHLGQDDLIIIGINEKDGTHTLAAPSVIWATVEVLKEHGFVDTAAAS